MSMPSLEMTDLLTPSEREEFSSLIYIVRMGVSGLVESGKALTIIRDKRLYREKYPNFEKFCEAEFRMSKSYAYRLISGLKNIEDLSNEVKPESEGVVRELKKVPSIDKQIIWNRALKMSDHPTADVVRRAAEIHSPDKHRQDRDTLARLRSAKLLLSKVDVSKVSMASLNEAMKLMADILRCLRDMMGSILRMGMSS